MKKLNITLLVILCVAAIACNKSESNSEEENEREIKIADLPVAITDNIAREFPEGTIKEADEVTQKDGSLTYDIEVEVNGKVVEYMYDAKGNYLGEEIDDDDSENEDGDD